MSLPLVPLSDAAYAALRRVGTSSTLRGPVEPDARLRAARELDDASCVSCFVARGRCGDHAGMSEAAVVDWQARARWIRTLGELQEAARRELDRAQVGEMPSRRLLDALVLAGAGWESYQLDVQRARSSG